VVRSVAYPAMIGRGSSLAKRDCKHHLIRCSKRRWALNDAELGAWIAETFRTIGEEFGSHSWNSRLRAIMSTSSLSFRRSGSAERVVGMLKSISVGRAFRQFPRLQVRFWSGELWKDG